MIATEHGYYCASGDMYLSPLLQRAFTAHFLDRSEPTPEVTVSYRCGGTWFCPGCGEQMTESGGAVRCSRCNANLTHYIYHLIEHHPHKSNATGIA